MDPLSIYLDYKKKQLRILCDWIYVSNQVQRIKISIGEKSMQLQNDYPLLKSTNSGKKIDWKVISGTPKDAAFLQRIILELEDYIKNYKSAPKTNPKNDHEHNVAPKTLAEAKKQKAIDEKYNDLEYPWGRS